MNDSRVTFAQVMLVLQIRLAVKMMRLEAVIGMKLNSFKALLTGQKQHTGLDKGRYWMARLAKGEKG